MQSDCTTPPLKTCTKCGREHPATLEFFRADERYAGGLQSWCKECKREYAHAYYAAHRENAAVYKAAYHATHREEISARQAAFYVAHREEKLAYAAAHREEKSSYMAAYYASHREERVAYNAAYDADHREERAAYQAVYRAAHVEDRAAYQLAWAAAHPEESRTHWRNRRARKRNAPGVHTAADVRAQYERQKGRCFYCDVKTGKKYHVDHVTPLVGKGSNGKENIVIACPACNLSKGAKHPMEFCGRLC